MGLIVAACLTLATQGAIRVGCDSVLVETADAQIQVFTYKSPSFDRGPMIVVCHGMLRNADEYRDDARTLADRLGGLVVAPQFPIDDFPYERYQAGGLLNEGQLAPRSAWTWQLMLDVIEEIRRCEGQPEMPYYLFGHSGGGQFLIRMAGFVTTDAERIVVANAGAQLFPSRDLPYPYGFGGLPEEVSNDAALARYLAQPITLYLGDDDRLRDEYLDITDEAELQGSNRRERARNSFEAARRLAKEKGWKFNWQLVTVPGVAHDHQKMLDHGLCQIAFRPPAKRTRHPAGRPSLRSTVAIRSAVAFKTRRTQLRR
jgi:pimeloyl-ACP methyl ester carboxylesterase